MTAPAVSVVIPAYNGAALIAATLDSVAAQSFADFEVLVVDDRSTDDTRAIVAAYPDPRVRLIEMAANGGPVVARNRAVAAARGRYIAGLDQDDLCHPDRFARQVAHLDANPGTVLVATDANGLAGEAIVPLGYPRRTTPALIAWLCWIENPIVWSTVMIRAAAAARLPVFTRPDILYAEDFDLYHRIGRLGAIARIDAPLLLYRQHPGGASQRFTERMRTSAARVLADRHATLLGDDAEAAATLLVRHVMGRVPVPDRATLAMLADIVDRLHRGFVAENSPDPADAALIRDETARRWSTIVRTGLRAGTLLLADAIAVRRTAPARDLAWPALVGGVRRARQTLAEKIIRPGPSAANT